MEKLCAGDLVGNFAGEPTDQNDVHVLWIESDDGWQGYLVSNILKYANHSATPNVEVDGFAMYACTDIAAGSELVFHYGEEWD